MNIDDFVRNEILIESWVPMLFIFSMLCLIPTLSYYLYEGKKKFFENNIIKAVFGMVVLALVLLVLIVITNHGRYNEWQEHINAGVRDRKRIFLNYVLYENDITREYNRNFYIADDFEALPMYEKRKVQTQEFTYLGFSDRGLNGSQYYFQIEDGIYTIASGNWIIEEVSGLDEPYLEGDRFFLNDMEWAEIGFYESRGNYVTTLYMPADAKEKKFEGDLERSYYEFSKAVEGWIFK